MKRSLWAAVLSSVVVGLLLVCSFPSFAIIDSETGSGSPVFADGPRPADFQPGGSDPAASAEPSRPAYRTDRILVKPKKGLALSRMAGLHARHKAKVRRTFGKIGNLQIVELPKGGNVLDLVDQYKKSGLVEYAEPDYIVHACVTEPNDPSYLDGSLWGLNNSGQSGGTPDADIDAPEAWDVIREAPDVIVAVIDTGVRYTHEDLAANMWVNPDETPGNGVDDDGNGYIDDVYGINAITGSGNPADDHGHGTHVAGTIGAVGNNGKGVVGVAWRVKIMACKFLNSSGYGETSYAIECMAYARAKGASILSNSWGGDEYSLSLRDAIAAARSDHDGKGTIFVAAAGNGGDDVIGDNTDYLPFYPSGYDLDNIVSVAATDRTDSPASFSNYGPVSVDLAAPGVSILSAYKTSDSAYSSTSGTSMATPHVSGALALMRTSYSGEGYQRLIRRALYSTDPLPSLAGRSLTGGRLNLQKALTATFTDLYVTPAGDLRFGGMPGGPFSAPRSYALINFGNASLSWTADKIQSWLNVTPAAGELAPDETVTVTVSVDPTQAGGLAPGSYSDAVTFTNVSTGSGNAVRGVTLRIGALRVKPGGSDSNDGSGWDSAKLTVQAGLDAANPGQDVWVAAGVYTQRITLSPGVGLYGGFAGTETSRGQRNSVSNVTVLDGAGGGSVVTSPPVADSTTVIDGFTVRNGSATRGGGVYCPSSITISNNIITGNTAGSGAGVYCSSCAPTISGNSITANTGTGFQSSGGGINSSSSSPVIEGNTIAGNSATNGGGIRCAYPAASPATISGNTISGNTCEFGGGVYCWKYSRPDVCRNVITGNTATRMGGGIHCDTDSPRIYGNTITGNKGSQNGGGVSCYIDNQSVISNNVVSGNASTNGGGLYIFQSDTVVANNTITSNAAMKGGAISCGSATPTIANDIVAFNSSGIEKDAASTVVLRDNCVYGNTVYNYSGWSTDPTGTDGNISADPRLPGSAYSNLHIQPDSPCVDAGDDSVVGPDWLDMDGQPRIQGDHVDIGADESDGTVWTVNARIVRVSLDGGDSNDGSAWNLAKRTVQAGIDAASTSGGEVWVKAGKYDERITLRTFAYVYGGFSGNETQRLERNWRGNVTVLDGGGSGSVVTSTDPGYLLSCVDGFTIRGGDASVGGGVYCNYSSPGIANNVITENHASSTGAGVYCYSSSAMISNNTITANNAVSRGGGIYGYSFAPTIVNNTVAGNNGSSGGGMGFLSSNPVVSNNIIAFNSSGIYKSLGSVTLNSNCVYGNTAYNYSGPAPGVGDISVDPLFVDGTGGDYHIARVSPCIDSGYDTGAPGFDADGMIRPQDGNGDGTAICDIGAYEYPLNLGAAKRTYPDGHPVALGGVSVTAVFAADGRIYVERTDRTSGVRVDTMETFSIGQVVNLSGALQTDPIAGERYVLASPPWPQPVGSIFLPAPLGLSNLALGGGAAGLQQGIAGTYGLNNIGLSVTAWGSVTEVESVAPPAAPTWFKIDDGTGVNVKCLVPSGVTIDEDWQYVAVTGISSCEKVDDELHRLLRVRSQEDIKPLLVAP